MANARAAVAQPGSSALGGLSFEVIEVCEAGSAYLWVSGPEAHFAVSGSINSFLELICFIAMFKMV